MDDSHYDPDNPLFRPYPVSLRGVNHIKNRAATVHYVFLAKPDVGRAPTRHHFSAGH